MVTCPFVFLPDLNVLVLFGGNYDCSFITTALNELYYNVFDHANARGKFITVKMKDEFILLYVILGKVLLKH